MRRTDEAIAADLVKIHGVLDGLSTGLKLAAPMIANQLGSSAAVDKGITPVLDALQMMATVLVDLDERQRELDKNQKEIVRGLSDMARELAA